MPPVITQMAPPPPPPPVISVVDPPQAVLRFTDLRVSLPRQPFITLLALPPPPPKPSPVVSVVAPPQAVPRSSLQVADRLMDAVGWGQPAFKAAPPMPTQPQPPLLLQPQPPPPTSAYRRPDVGRHSHNVQTRVPANGTWPWDATNPSVRPSIQHWFPALRVQWYVDEDSIGRLSRLSTESIEGYQEAISIIVKLIKGVCDDRPIYNASAFVHTAVKNARRDLRSPEPEDHR